MDDSNNRGDSLETSLAAQERNIKKKGTKKPKLGRPKKAHVQGLNKPRKIYKPKGVTLITAKDLKMHNLKNGEKTEENEEEDDT